MSNVALVSHDVQTVGGRAGGVGAFVTHFAGLLREAGEEVTIILARAEAEPLEVDEAWRARYRSMGVRLIELHNTLPQADRRPDVWPVRLSEQVLPLIKDLDVVYFSDWANVGFVPVREKRFTRARRPVYVTVLHGASTWVRLRNSQYPKVPEDQYVDFVERYTALHSDYVIAPSRYMLDWVKERGWQFRGEPEVLGLPFRDAVTVRPETASGPITRLVFLGRLEARKGFGLFSSAVSALAERSTVLGQVNEIALVGPEYDRAVADQIRREMERPDRRVSHVSNLDSLGVRDYLLKHASSSLVVIASPVENFPYSVIEASTIPGLNLICSRGGGIPEVFEERSEGQLFDPHPTALAAKIEERLTAPLQVGELAVYDYDGANRRWLESHDRISRGVPSVVVEMTVRPRVDVCVSYFNKERHFPQLLCALKGQTHSGFGVIAADDGSTSPAARATFDSMADQYSSRGWRFFRQENLFVDAARNSTAKRSSADYLLFIDADDCPAPNAVERLMEAADISGCDCLLSYSALVSDDAGPPPGLLSGSAPQVRVRYVPLGPDLVTGLVDPTVFGTSMILIRRAAFEAIGGYREIRGVAHEDWELQVRLLLAGYQTDVVPEFLCFIRQLSDGLTRTSDDFAAKQRLLEMYEMHLTGAGLHGLATAVHALQRRCEELEGVVRQNVPLDVRLRLHDRLRALLSQTSR